MRPDASAMKLTDGVSTSTPSSVRPAAASTDSAWVSATPGRAATSSKSTEAKSKVPGMPLTTMVWWTSGLSTKRSTAESDRRAPATRARANPAERPMTTATAEPSTGASAEIGLEPIPPERPSATPHHPQVSPNAGAVARRRAFVRRGWLPHHPGGGLDGGGQGAGDLVGETGVLGLDHDPDEGLGAAGPDQDPAPGAQSGLGFGDGPGQVVGDVGAALGPRPR